MIFLKKIKNIFKTKTKKKKNSKESYYDDEVNFIKNEYEKFLMTEVSNKVKFNTPINITTILNKCVVTAHLPQIKYYIYNCKYNNAKLHFRELDNKCILIYYSHPQEGSALIGKVFADENSYRHYEQYNNN